MKRATNILAAAIVLFVTNATFAQDAPGPGFEHLKGYGPLIGTWRYEGPLLEDLGEIAGKDTEIVGEFSWKWILNKSAVEYRWSIDFAGGETLSGKALIGWNAAEKEIIAGGMSSTGNMRMGTVKIDETAKTTISTWKGVDGEGEEISSTNKVAVTGKDTLTFQALEREGGLVEGPSPVFTFKRVKRAQKQQSE